MKIVVTDGYTINPGDLSWDKLKEFGQVDVYDRTDPEEFYERVKDAEIILTNKAVLYQGLLDKLDKLKYVGVTATGINVIDLELASDRGIVVTNVPGYGTEAVAQHVFALLLELTNSVGKTSENVHKGRWQEVGEWCYWDQPLIELSKKTMGIIGMGLIGQKVGEIAEAFGMRVQYSSPRKKDVKFSHVSLEELCQSSDVISLHCPLNEKTDGLINRDRLKVMKPTAILINTGRGQLINEQDLAKALKEDTIGAAALDVLSEEPPKANPLIGAPNCLITPHHAWAARESRQRLIDISIDNVRAYLAGERQNVVN